MKEIEEEIMIQYYNGSIFDSKADILCHQVNCQGAFGYGIAGQVKKLFPEVEKTYKRITKQWIEKENVLLMLLYLLLLLPVLRCLYLLH